MAKHFAVQPRDERGKNGIGKRRQRPMVRGSVDFRHELHPSADRRASTTVLLRQAFQKFARGAIEVAVHEGRLLAAAPESEGV